MAWIKVNQNLKDHRKLLTAADELEINPAHMLGLLVSFWLWAVDNAPSGSLEGITNRMIARAAQWEGNPDAFVDAITVAGLLRETSEGLEINDWYEYTGKLIEQREAEKNRSRRRRAAAAAAENDRRTTAGQPPDRPEDDRKTTGGREEKSRVEKSRVDIYTSESTEPQPEGEILPVEPEAPPAAEPVPYKEIVAMYHEICKSYPTLRNVSDNRKKAIAARWKEYKHNLDTFRELFERAEASQFLKGKNARNWTADFNWLMNSENMAKVLEGKYDNNDRPGGLNHGEYSGHTERTESTAEPATLSGFQMADD